MKTLSWPITASFYPVRAAPNAPSRETLITEASQPVRSSVILHWAAPNELMSGYAWPDWAEILQGNPS